MQVFFNCCMQSFTYLFFHSANCLISQVIWQLSLVHLLCFLWFLDSTLYLYPAFIANRPISQVIRPPWFSLVQIFSPNFRWKPCLFIRIDENSPLWEVSPIDLLTETFEIVLTMEGTTPETGNNIQVRTIIFSPSWDSKSNPGSDILCPGWDTVGLQIRALLRPLWQTRWQIWSHLWHLEHNNQGWHSKVSMVHLVRENH